MQKRSTKERFKFKNYPVSMETLKQYTQLNSRKIESGKRHLLLNWIVKGIIWLCLKLSWQMAYDLGTFLGRLLYRFNLRRSIAMVNLDIVYGKSKSQEELEQIYKASMINLGRLIFNYIRLPYQPPSFWEKQVHPVNLHLLTAALNEHRGVIALAAHLGVIDLAAGYLGHTGYPVSVVGKRIKNQFWDKFVLDTRLAMNVGSIRHRNSMKRILKGLKSGETIVMALDQNMQRKQGTFLNWMGRPASSVYASGYLAQKYNVPIVAGYCWQKGPQDFELVFTERVPWLPYPEDTKKEMLMNAQNHADATQRMILGHPEVWFWIHKRWRVQPEGMTTPYE